MDIFTALFIFCTALFIVVRSAKWILSTIQSFGNSLNISPFVMGTVALGFGTSLPELFASLFAIQRGLVDIPIPITIGSNIVILTLIFGIFVIVASRKKRSLFSTQETYTYHTLFFAIAVLSFLLFAVDGAVGWVEGAILFLIMTAYTVFIVKQQQRKKKEVLIDDGLTKREKERLIAPFLIIHNLVKFFVAVSIISFSSYLLVDSLQALALGVGVGPEVVALILLAFGTSVPEIAVTITALKQNKLRYAFGNILGTSIFNIGAVVGFVSFFNVLVLDAVSLKIALPFLFVSSALFFYAVYFKKQNPLLGYASLFLFILFLYSISIFSL